MGEDFLVSVGGLCMWEVLVYKYLGGKRGQRGGGGETGGVASLWTHWPFPDSWIPEESVVVWERLCHSHGPKALEPWAWTCHVKDTHSLRTSTIRVSSPSCNALSYFPSHLVIISLLDEDFLYDDSEILHVV